MTDTVLEETLGEKYADFQQNPTQGGMRTSTIARWGPGGKQVIIKTDKEPASQHARYLARRGYTSSHDAKILSRVQEPRRFGMSQVLDFGTLPDGRAYVTEEHVDARDLERLVREDGPMTGRDAGIVFGNVLRKTVQGLHDAYGLLHRDLKPSNILIAHDLETTVTDWQTAAPERDLRPSALPSMGSHWIRDPLTIDPLGEGRYTQRSEIYALGVSMLYGLTGRYWFEYDQDGAFARFTAVDGSVRDLFENGARSVRKHEAALTEALDTLPKDARQYKTFLRKALTIDAGKRYASIDDAVKGFADDATRPGRSSRLRKALVTSLAALSLLGAAGASLWTSYKDRVATVESESRQLPLTVRFDGRTGVIDNNAVEFTAYVVTEQPDDSYARTPGDAPFAYVQRGEKICVLMTTVERPIPRDRYPGTIPDLDGKVYLAGFFGEEFHTDILGSDTTRSRPELFMQSVGQSNGCVTVPSWLPDGTYPLVAELYSPTPEEVAASIRRKGPNPVVFPEKSIVMNQVQIPLVVGNATPFIMRGMEMEMHLSSKNPSFEYSPRVVFANPDVYRNEVTFDGGYGSGPFTRIGRLNRGGFTIPLPQRNVPEHGIISILARTEQGSPTGYAFLQVRNDCDYPAYAPKGVCEWTFDIPDRSNDERLKQLREGFLPDPTP